MTIPLKNAPLPKRYAPVIFDENVALFPATFPILAFAVVIFDAEIVSNTKVSSKSSVPSIFAYTVLAVMSPSTTTLLRNMGDVSNTKLPVPVTPGAFVPVPPYSKARIPDEIFEAFEALTTTPERKEPLPKR